MKKNHGSRKATMEVAQKVEEDEENQLMEPKDLFELFDPDGKGFITKQDFHRLITQIPQMYVDGFGKI